MGREPDTGIDFGKLNAAERTALSLLARGHTAKSIANLTDRSVGAVNERLREARRKTGVARVSRIRCGDTACEIVGTFARSSGEKQINGAMQRMQGKSFTDAAAALGLKLQTAGFGESNNGDSNFAMFVARK